MDNTGNPIIVDAADVAAADLVVWPYNIHVLQIEFSGGNANDVAAVYRGNGKLFWNGEIGVDLKSVRSGTLGWSGTHGLKVLHSGIPHGQIKIFHR